MSLRLRERVSMNIGKPDGDTAGVTRGSSDVRAESLDAEAVHVPLPDNIDDLFARPEVESLQLDVDDAASAQYGTASFDDVYYEHSEDTFDQLNPNDMKKIESHPR